MKIGIAHRNIVSRDAIGNDILGMYEVLAESGFEVELIGEHFDAETKARARTSLLDEPTAPRDLALLIYHHSIYWPAGEALLGAIEAPCLLKYHNVTPGHFFAPYAPRQAKICAAGRAQTARLVQLAERKGGRLSADSSYNAAELAKAGAATEIAIVAPFNDVAALARPASPLAAAEPVRILFVGRLVPNKNHLALLSTTAAFVASFGPAVELTLVGGLGADLENYRTVLEREIDRLGIRPQVRLLDQVDDTALRQLYRTAGIFLCLSEHEGFCVPVIEAQAAGVPVISVGTGALAETIGPDQLVVAPPTRHADFLTIAGLIHAACSDARLRRQLIAAGHRNVLSRFTRDEIADRFMGALLPILERAA